MVKYIQESRHTWLSSSRCHRRYRRCCRRRRRRQRHRRRRHVSAQKLN